MDKRSTRIITFLDSENYGAIFQAWALSEYVKKFSDRVVFIPHKRSSRNSLRYYINRPVRFLLGYGERMRKTKAFKQAWFNLESTGNEDVNAVVIIGSDQLWQPKLLEDGDKFYLGDEIGYYGKLVSYASSFGVTSGLDEWNDEYKRYLSRIKSIAVREKSGKTFIESLGLKAVVTVDPTLLLPREYYNSLLRQSKISIGKYVLCYVMTGDTKGTNAIIQLARTENPDAEIVVLGDREINFFKQDGYTRMFNCGPEDFIALMARATRVYTSSFHGTCFSIIFNREFCVCLNRENPRNVRVEDLLKSLDHYRLMYIDERGELHDYSGTGLDDLQERIEFSRNYLIKVYEE